MSNVQVKIDLSLTGYLTIPPVTRLLVFDDELSAQIRGMDDYERTKFLGEQVQETILDSMITVSWADSETED